MNIFMGDMGNGISPDTPMPPNIVRRQDGKELLVCPRCGRNLNVFEHDEEHDHWLLSDRCMVCGQAIYDEQKVDV